MGNLENPSRGLPALRSSRAAIHSYEACAGAAVHFPLHSPKVSWGWAGPPVWEEAKPLSVTEKPPTGKEKPRASRIPQFLPLPLPPHKSCWSSSIYDTHASVQA